MQLGEVLDPRGNQAAWSVPRDAARPARLRAVAASHSARQMALLACYCAAGIVVTWPRTAYLTTAASRR